MNVENENRRLPRAIQLLTTLRWLVAIQVLLGIFTFVIYSMQQPFLHSLLQEYENLPREEYGAFEIVLTVLEIAVVVLWIISAVAICQGKRIGRALYTTVVVSGLVIGFLYKESVSIAALDVVFSAACVCDGIILGLLYFSELRFHFEKASQPPPAPAGTAPQAG